MAVGQRGLHELLTRARDHRDSRRNDLQLPRGLSLTLDHQRERLLGPAHSSHSLHTRPRLLLLLRDDINSINYVTNRIVLHERKMIGCTQYFSFMDNFTLYIGQKGFQF